MGYKSRIIETELQRKFSSAGALLVRGPKACGKTETAKQFAKSVIQVDIDPNFPTLLEFAPQKIFENPSPLLLDEWQSHPEIWELVRHEVDRRKEPGQFILTGSANPEEQAKMHSGAGRFNVVDMRTMSWQELGDSKGSVSLQHLFKNGKIEFDNSCVELEKIIERIIIGGFPSLMNKSIEQAKDVNRAYITLLAEVDMSRVSKIKRDPNKVKSLLKSIARNTSTTVEMSTFEKDIFEKDAKSISRTTVYDYIEVLNRQMILEDQPAWNTHLRSSHQLRKSPKRHFTDVALAVAALGADENTLLNDLNFTGFLFESMVTHDLRVYAQANDAEVFHYRDASDLEIDAIVQKYNGHWCAFEIKLGTKQIDEAAHNLLRFAEKIDTSKQSAPRSLNIITGTGMTYTRKDGVNVISIGSLGR
jgi:predicted AAA+ superfamily ATPase